MQEKIERLTIAACVGIVGAAILSWVIFFPMPPEAICVPETHPFGCETFSSPHGEHVQEKRTLVIENGAIVSDTGWETETLSW